MKLKFNFLDRAVITGDTAGMGHDFATGEEVVIVGWLEDPTGTVIRYRCFLTPTSTPSGEWEPENYRRDWWVEEQDLELVGPTDQEINQAVQSIQQAQGGQHD